MADGNLDFGIDIKIDWKQLADDLGEHKRLVPYIARDIMRKVNRAIIKDLKQQWKGKGYKVSKINGPYKNVASWASLKFNAGIYIKRAKGENEYGSPYPYYSMALEKGATIRPKDDDGYLTFYKDGQWHKVKEVTIRPELNVWNTWKDWWSSDKAMQIADAELQRQLNKIYERAMRKK